VLRLDFGPQSCQFGTVRLHLAPRRLRPPRLLLDLPDSPLQVHAQRVALRPASGELPALRLELRAEVLQSSPLGGDHGPLGLQRAAFRFEIGHGRRGARPGDGDHFVQCLRR
jgi:hypothetical protein